MLLQDFILVSQYISAAAAPFYFLFSDSNRPPNEPEPTLKLESQAIIVSVSSG